MTPDTPNVQPPGHNPFNSLLALLVISLAIITAYSFSDSPLTLGIKRSGIAAYLKGDTIVLAVLIPPPSADSVSMVDTTPQSILLIGDSMLEGLSPRFQDYAQQNGHEFNSVLWYSSTTKYFGECDTLSYFIRKYHPTFILLSIGANELFVRDIKTERSGFVAHILQEIDTIPYVWIGPPNWREDTGINELIVEHVGAKHYYPSKRLQFERTKDGAHPTHQSSALWVDSVARWIMDSSAHRIVLNQPDITVKRDGNGIRELLKPLR